MILVAKSEHDPRWLHRHATPEYHRSETAIAKMSAADRAELDRILEDRSKIGAQVRRAFLDAIDRLSQQIDVEPIAQLIRDGRVGDALNSVNTQLVTQGLRPIAASITSGTIAAAQSAVDALGELNVVFGITNPGTVSFLANYEMASIRLLTADALGSVQAALTAGIQAGRNPLDTARDILAFIGLTPRQAQAVLNYRTALETRNSDALGRALRDARFDPTVRRAIQGEIALKPEQIDRMVDRYRERYLRYRSETIARTESIRAVSAGNHLMWTQAVEDGQVAVDQIRRSWIYIADDKVRDAHRMIPSMNKGGVGLNQPFQSILGPIMYPGDPNATAANVINCRCATITRYIPRIAA